MPVADSKEKDGNDFVMLRVPRKEYERLKDAREKMQQTPDYSWVGSLALGAFVGFLLTQWLDENKKK